MSRGWLRRNGLRLAVHLGAWLPLAWLLWTARQGLLWLDPVGAVTTLTGKAALILLTLSLACTPVVTLTGWQSVGRVRRALGLYAALYAGLHFVAFVWLDYGLDPALLAEAVRGQGYVIVGLAAGLILLALALTSTQGWQRRLGRGWKRLHRLVYLAALLAAAHFLWSSKDPREPLRYLILIVLLLALRLPWPRRVMRRLRRQTANPPPV